jgi:hypothetical protein
VEDEDTSEDIGVSAARRSKNSGAEGL